MKKTCKTLLALLLLAAALWGLCTAVTPLLTPKRYDYGCLWQAYEKEDRNSIDVMFLAPPSPIAMSSRRRSISRRG